MQDAPPPPARRITDGGSVAEELRREWPTWVRWGVPIAVGAMVGLGGSLAMVQTRAQATADHARIEAHHKGSMDTHTATDVEHRALMWGELKAQREQLQDGIGRIQDHFGIDPEAPRKKRKKRRR